MQLKRMTKDNAYRPQANFLPQAPKRGTLDVISQNPSKRIQKEKEEEEARKATVAVLWIAHSLVSNRIKHFLY